MVQALKNGDEVKTVKGKIAQKSKLPEEFEVRPKVELQASTLNSHASQGNVLVNPRAFPRRKKCLLFMMLVRVRKKVCGNAGQGLIHYFSHRLSSLRRFSNSSYRLISFSV